MRKIYCIDFDPSVAGDEDIKKSLIKKSHPEAKYLRIIIASSCEYDKEVGRIDAAEFPLEKSRGIANCRMEDA